MFVCVKYNRYRKYKSFYLLLLPLQGIHFYAQCSFFLTNICVHAHVSQIAAAGRPLTLKEERGGLLVAIFANFTATIYTTGLAALFGMIRKHPTYIAIK